METMQDLIDQLKAERNEHASVVTRIDRAIELLGHNGANGSTHATTHRTMSLAARRKISLAMKRHHAARRNGTSSFSGNTKKKLHWTQTPEGRKKFAAIRAKAHRKAA
jgi:hypothetical protein